jgi:putative FmdB family regulatory protein
MPVYEFFCKKCNTIFNFFSKTINPSKQPSCPKCSGNLKKQVSTFACVDSSRKEPDPGNIPFDEKKLEKIMGRLEAETENIN